MNAIRDAPLVGIAGALAVVLLFSVPYVLVGTEAGSGVSTYYGTGAVNPLVGGLFALVAVLVLAAGREERTDPGLAAGVALALGVFLFVLTGLWAATVPADVVLGLTTNTLLEHHRWVLAGASAVVPVAAAWWARALGLL